MLNSFGFAGAKTDSTTNEAAPAPADQSMTRTSNANTYLMPFDCQVAWAAAINDTITRARLNYPSYRDLGFPEITPLIALAKPSAAFAVCDWGTNGPRVRKTEEFGIDTTNGASTIDQIGAIVSIIDRIDPIPAGRRFTVRGTAAQTLVLYNWTIGTITLDQTLPFGRYGVIGMACVCDSAYAARLVFPQNTSMRPGVVPGTAIANYDYRQIMRAGRFGLLGTFDQTAPPQLEVLGEAAGAQTPAVYLDLVELRG